MLFYSQRCSTCANLMQLLSDEGILGNFKLVCVDNRLQQIPPQITHVPTMIVKSVNKPLVTQECFKYIEQLRFMRQAQIYEENKRIIQKNVVQNQMNQAKGPLRYSDSEMEGISDGFALLDTDAYLPHTYFRVGDEENNAIFTAPEQKSISKGEQEKRMNMTEQLRKQQDKNYEDFNKEQRIKAVLSAEQKNFNCNS